MIEGKRICIIGGGASGLTSIKNCLDHGLHPVCYEKSSAIGGLWNYEENSGKVKYVKRATVMQSTVVNSSKEMYAFSDFPAPVHWPNYTHNSKVKQYLKMYAEKFNLEKYVTFNVSVTKVEQSCDYQTTGKWVVHMEKGDIEIFDGVILCTGHHADAHVPHFDGLEGFQGRVIHSQMYKNWREFKNQRVLVVGFGNSAMDISTELSDFCPKVYLSTRRGGYIWPRIWMRGIPNEAWYNTRWKVKVVQHFFPWFLLNAYFENVMNKRYDHLRFDLQPKHRFWAQHPTINDRLPTCLAQGSVLLKGNVERFTKSSVIFKDGTEYQIDSVILCTGYTFGFPYLQQNIIPVNDNVIRLYKHVFPPDLPHPTLSVIGVLQPNAPLFPLMELQARWVCSVLSNKCSLPTRDFMEKDIEKHLNLLSNQYFRSMKHTIQENWLDYADQLTEFIGAKPNFKKLFFTDPKLWCVCFFYPYTPFNFRLNDSKFHDDARTLVMTSYDRVISATKTRRCESNKSFFCLSPIIKVIFAIVLAVVFTSALSLTGIRQSSNLILLFFVYSCFLLLYIVCCCVVSIFADSIFDWSPIIR